MVLIIVDWGDMLTVIIEKVNAVAVNDVSQTHPSLFVVFVGDNFYEDGVSALRNSKFQTFERM